MLAQLAAPRFARCALEMSGINPAVVLANVDLELAADCIVGCATALAGEKCTATRRVLVAEPVHNALVSRLADRIGVLRLGDPRDRATDVGPLIAPAARATADAAVERSLAAGARLVARAPTVEGAGLFAPALLTDLHSEDPLRTQELFAPVLSVEPVRHDRGRLESGQPSPVRTLRRRLWPRPRRNSPRHASVCGQGCWRSTAAATPSSRRRRSVVTSAPATDTPREGSTCTAQ